MANKRNLRSKNTKQSNIKKHVFLQGWRVLNSFGIAPNKSKSRAQSTAISSMDTQDVCITHTNSDGTSPSRTPMWRVDRTPIATPPPLHVVSSDSRPEGREDPKITGRRLVDIIFFIDELKKLSSHGPQFGCTFVNLNLVTEICGGLRSGFVFECDMCHVKQTVWSEPSSTKSQTMDVNAAAVAGVMNVGGGFSSLRKLTGALNIRCMNEKTFAKHELEVSDGWEKAALAEMKAAVQEEIQLARERGDVDQNNVPLLTVVADGCWSKRSYRTNYNALSGVAAIVGYHTRKVLYFGVKNKYCVTCARASNSNAPVPAHQCFKNWTDSSCSMESAVIVEGFMQSEDMYGVKYATLIADGDSSVYCKIIESRPYLDLTVRKIECRNHLLRNYVNKLKDIASTTSKDLKSTPDRTDHIAMRKVIGSSLLRCRAAVTKAIQKRKSEPVDKATKIQNLRKDLINGPSHVFGEHRNCAELNYFCIGKQKDGEKNFVPLMIKCGIYAKVMDAVDGLSSYAQHLIEDVDSNRVEHYNSTVAVFTGGKRTNLVQRNGYKTRCAAAVVSHNSKTPFSRLHRTMKQSSPGNFSKSYELKSKIKAESEWQRRSKHPKVRRALALNTPSTTDKDYGPNAQKPDLAEDMYKMKVEEHMTKLCRSVEELRELERATVTQSACWEWAEERRIRLTASNFGLICNRKPYSSCAPVITRLLYTNVECTATKYGQRNERLAIASVEQELGMTVEKCGLFIDSQLQFLGATPDGLIGEDGIVEVKCPASGSQLTPEQVILQKKGMIGSFWYDNSGKLAVKKRHTYHFQIQGQLHITGRKYCLFVLWTPLGTKIERIERDDEFWKSEMVDKLTRFYYDCLLPELVDPRRRRSLPIREPSRIIEAQRNLNKINEAKKKK